MTLSITAFRVRFPEFDGIADELVQAKLDQAANSINETAWGDLAEDGHGQLAAHLLALSPQGAQAGLRMGGGANQRTIYQDIYEDLRRQVGQAYRAVLP